MAKVLKIPLLHGVVAGLAVNFAKLQIPEPIFRPLGMTGSAAMLAMLLILGIGLPQG